MGLRGFRLRRNIGRKTWPARRGRPAVGAVMAAVPSVAAVTAVEKVHQRAGGQQQEGQPPEQVSAVFRQQEEQADRREGGEDPRRGRTAAGAPSRWAPARLSLHEISVELGMRSCGTAPGRRGKRGCGRKPGWRHSGRARTAARHGQPLGTDQVKCAGERRARGRLGDERLVARAIGASGTHRARPATPSRSRSMPSHRTVEGRRRWSAW